MCCLLLTMLLAGACGAGRQILTGSVSVSEPTSAFYSAQVWCAQNTPYCPDGELPPTDSVELQNLKAELDGISCTGEWMYDGYSDLDEGAEVTVRDGEGNVAGIGRLGLGTLSVVTTATAATCVFPFEVELEKTDFYQLSLAGRDAPSYTFEGLEAAGWRVDLMIGG